MWFRRERRRQRKQCTSRHLISMLLASMCVFAREGGPGKNLIWASRGPSRNGYGLEMAHTAPNRENVRDHATFQENATLANLSTATAAKVRSRRAMPSYLVAHISSGFLARSHDARTKEPRELGSSQAWRSEREPKGNWPTGQC